MPRPQDDIYRCSLYRRQISHYIEPFQASVLSTMWGPLRPEVVFFPFLFNKFKKKLFFNTQHFHNVAIPFYIQREPTTHLNRAK